MSPLLRRKVNLFVFAHPDDEFFVLPLFEAFSRLGEESFVFYLTNGSAYGVDPLKRFEESRSILTQWGVPASHLQSIGITHEVKDLTLHQALKSTYEGLHSFLKEREVTRIITHAWEGGHPDHDAAHLIALRLVKERGLEKEFYEFSAYHTWRGKYPFIRCMKLIPSNVPDRTLSVAKSLSASIIIKWMKGFWGYPSQWKTFLGLFPFSLFAILLRRSVPVRLVPARDYMVAPHEGELLSEKRFNVGFSEFLSASSPFILETLSTDNQSKVSDTQLGA